MIIEPTATIFLGQRECLELYRDYKNAVKRLLLLDYDGSLREFTDTPSEALPAERLLTILKDLAADSRNDIYIISGRDGHTLDNWFKDVRLNIIAEHGAASKHYGGGWEYYADEGVNWKTDIGSILSGYAGNLAGSFVEQKKYSLAWHYRQSEPSAAGEQARELISELNTLAPRFNLEILDGNKVIEVRQKGVNKGVAAARVIGKKPYDFILCIGDDKTDEDMFRELSATPCAYTIKVGDDLSFAKYNVHVPHRVHALLSSLSDLGD